MTDQLQRIIEEEKTPESILSNCGTFFLEETDLGKRIDRSVQMQIEELDLEAGQKEKMLSEIKKAIGLKVLKDEGIVYLLRKGFGGSGELQPALDSAQAMLNDMFASVAR